MIRAGRTGQRRRRHPLQWHSRIRRDRPRDRGGLHAGAVHRVQRVDEGVRVIGQPEPLPCAVGMRGIVGIAGEEVMRRLLTRAALEHRSDDIEDVIARRLALYHEVTAPIIDWYAARGILVSADAMRPVEQVGREVLAALEVLRPLVGVVPPGARRAIDLTGPSAAFGN
jgi:hypothetical protein